MGFIKDIKDEMLRREFNNKYIGLHVSGTTPDAATGANFSEPINAKYRREPLSVAGTTVSVMDNLELVNGTGTNSRMVKNRRVIEFQPMTSAVTVSHYGIVSEATGGTPRFLAPLTNAQGQATSVEIPANAVFLFDYDATTGTGNFKVEFADEDTTS